jgi:3-mercaptopyruvate sulfurtransferase SseA
VAQKLNAQYGYSYDNLKVLLGGWTAWQNAGYPTETGAGGGAPAPPAGAAITNTVVITP